MWKCCLRLAEAIACGCGRSDGPPQSVNTSTTAHLVTSTVVFAHCSSPSYKWVLHLPVSISKITLEYKPTHIRICRANSTVAPPLVQGAVATGRTLETVTTCAVLVEVGEAPPPDLLTTPSPRPISKRAWTRPRSSRRYLSRRALARQRVSLSRM